MHEMKGQSTSGAWTSSALPQYYFLVLGFKVGTLSCHQMPLTNRWARRPAQLLDVTAVNLPSLTTVQEVSEDNGTAYIQMVGHVVVKLSTLMCMSLPKCLPCQVQPNLHTNGTL